MKNKNIAKFGIPILLMVSLTECTTVLNSTAYAEETISTQTLEIPQKAFGIIELKLDEKRFSRVEPSIVETQPWLNPKKKNYMLSDSELISILKQAGFSGKELKMAWAIAIEESTSRPYALNKSSNCYGLFQINMSGAMGPDRRSRYELTVDEDLYDPLTNAKIAYDMSSGGVNWSAWEAYPLAKKTVKKFPG